MRRTAPRPTYPCNPTLRAIATGRRREILRLLLDRGSTISERELASGLAEMGADSAGTRRFHTELVHEHLPLLDATGLVTWCKDDETTEATTHPALEDPRFRQLLDIDGEEVDEVLSAIAHERRRIVLSVLRETPTATTRNELATEIRRCESELPDVEPGATDLPVSLRHVHLPRLADIGAIEYDADTDRVAYAGHPTVETVFRTIFEPSEQMADKLDGFLGGLKSSYRQASRNASQELDWPHFWRNPQYD